MAKETKTYNPELHLRASQQWPNTFYLYVNDYVLASLKQMATEAEAAMETAIPDENGKKRAGPISFRILTDDDRRFYTEKRKFQYAPDGVISFSRPKQDDQAY